VERGCVRGGNLGGESLKSCGGKYGAKRVRHGDREAGRSGNGLNDPSFLAQTVGGAGGRMS